MEKGMGDSGGIGSCGLPYETFGILAGVAAGCQGVAVGQEFMDNAHFAKGPMENGVDPEEAAKCLQGEDIEGMFLANMGHLVTEDGLAGGCIEGDLVVPEQAGAKGKGGARFVGGVKANAVYAGGRILPGKPGNVEEGWGKPEKKEDGNGNI